MPARASPSRSVAGTEDGIGAVSAARGETALTATSLPSEPASARPAQAESMVPLLPTVAIGSGTRGDRPRYPFGHAHRIESRAVVQAQDLSAVGDGEGGRGEGRRLALTRIDARFPRPREQGAEEVLARDGEKQRPAEVAQPPQAPQNLEVVVGREVEVEPGVQRDLLLVHPEVEGALDLPGEPGLQMCDGIAVAPGRPVDSRGALDVHEHVAATYGAHHLQHRVIAAADVVDRRGSGVDGPACDLHGERVGA